MCLTLVIIYLKGELGMKAKKLVLNGQRELDIIDVELPDLTPKSIRIKALYSAISQGTELRIYNGGAPNFYENYDRDTRLFLDDGNSNVWNYPISLGYQSVGKVVQVGLDVKDIRPGELVFSWHPHQSEYVVEASNVIKVGKNTNPKCAVVSAMAMVAYNGILYSYPTVGETVVVSGLGAIGLLTVSFLKNAGITVIGIDPVKTRREIARSFGASFTLDPLTEDCALEIRKLTSNLGADSVIECSGTFGGLNEAIRCVTPNGVVVAVGWYHDMGRLILSKEFHMNNIQLKSAQVEHIPPELSKRFNIQRRNKIALEMLRQVDVAPMLYPVVPFNKAPEVYMSLVSEPSSSIVTIFQY
jgi:threonine dehydrogenase-like Zn-dependent dehydrogenase